jgi:hypothetical protein
MLMKAREKLVPHDNQTFTAMIPGKFIRFMRQCPSYQFYRFICINIKMIIVARKH